MESNNAKQRILLAAKELFFTKGYVTATIREIAAKSNVSLALPNYYFGSKKALGAKVYFEIRKTLIDFFYTIFDEKIDKFVKSFTIVATNMYLTLINRRFCELFLSIVFDDSMIEIVKEASPLLKNKLNDDPEKMILHLVCAMGSRVSLLYESRRIHGKNIKAIVRHFTMQYFSPLELPPKLADYIFEVAYNLIMELKIDFTDNFQLTFNDDYNVNHKIERNILNENL